MSQERVRFWHQQIMRETQFARMHRQDPPTVWISSGLYDMIFDSLVVGEHMISVKYSAPLDDTTVNTNNQLNGVFSMIGGGLSGDSVRNAYQAGYVWKYEYNKGSDSMRI